MGSAGKNITEGLNKINQVIFNILNMIMKLSPVGAFGGMASIPSENLDLEPCPCWVS